MRKTSVRGRPQSYTPELAKEICDVITSTSKGTKRLCAEYSHWPCQDTLFTWLKQYPEFSEQYKRAKICQVELLVDELIDIADDSSQDLVTDESGTVRYNAGCVARSKLRIETRKWIAARLVPRVYGTKGDEDSYTSNGAISEEMKQLRDHLAKQWTREY
jgi:hypothetical protein